MDCNADTARPDPDDHFFASYPVDKATTEFKRIYPPDAFGQELGSNARVWKVYKDESTVYDKAMLDAWNKTLDILLIFAGLFSAVATAFVIESYKLLQPDYGEYIAETLFKALSEYNSSVLLDARLALSAPSDFTPSPPSRWLNGLWFTSLVLSLVVAFLCILLKQWIEEYHSRTMSASFSSVKQWARRRAFYFHGLTTWSFPIFIAVLPPLLHTALFLFLTGLTLLLWTLDFASAVWILFLTAALLCFYVTSTIIPFLRADCPSATPLVRLLRQPIRSAIVRARFRLSSIVVTALTWANARLRGLISYAFQFAKTFVQFLIPRRLKLAMWKRYWRFERSSLPSGWHISTPSFDPALSDLHLDLADAHALIWLKMSGSNAAVARVGFHAAGAVPPWSPIVAAMRATPDLSDVVSQVLITVYNEQQSGGAHSNTTADVARDLRSMLCLEGVASASHFLTYIVPSSLRTASTTAIDYDLPVLSELLRIMTTRQNASVHDLNRFRRSYATIDDPSPPPQMLLSTAQQLLTIAELPLDIWLHLCRSLTLHDIPRPEFVKMTEALLRYKGYDGCPLRNLHIGQPCGGQCAYELLSDIVLSPESSGISDAAARVGLEILLHFARVHPRRLRWVFLERSHFMDLLGSEILVSHDMPFYGSAISALSQHLEEIAHSWRDPNGLPLWNDVWYRAINGLLNAAKLARERAVRSGANGVAPRVAGAILTLFHMSGESAHVDIRTTDDVARLPTSLLEGGQTSTWALMTTFPFFDNVRSLDAVAGLLAAFLCTASRRGVNVDTQFQTFVSGNYVVDTVHAMHARDVELGHDDYFVQRFVTLIRHFNEIRADWSLQVTERALDTHDAGYNTSLKSFIDYVFNEAARCGPCRECPNSRQPSRPSRWISYVRQTRGTTWLGFPQNRT